MMKISIFYSHIKDIAENEGIPMCSEKEKSNETDDRIRSAR